MNKKPLYIISFVWFVIDFLSKKIVINNLVYNKSLTIINNFFNLTYVKNRGGAFNFLNGGVIFIIIITIIIFFFIYKYLKDRELMLIEIWGYGLIIGGAIGNLFDRIIYGYVIDFLDFYVLGYDFPVFNIADCGIVIGIFMLLIYSFRSEGSDKNGDKS